MTTAICYYSRHHGNTKKVLEAMAEGQDVELIDVTVRRDVQLEKYDAVGFASGVYYGKFHDSVLDFAKRNLPEGKNVFFVYTGGSPQKSASKGIREIAEAKGSRIMGEYSCKGFDTFGPFKLVGGIAKGHPNEKELQKAKEFYRSICK